MSKVPLFILLNLLTHSKTHNGEFSEVGLAQEAMVFEVWRVVCGRLSLQFMKSKDGEKFNSSNYSILILVH